MNKVLEYVVINANDVQKLIEKGWQPFGSPFIRFQTRFTDDVYQAMVRYEEEPEGLTKPAIGNVINSAPTTKITYPYQDKPVVGDGHMYTPTEAKGWLI